MPPDPLAVTMEASLDMFIVKMGIAEETSEFVHKLRLRDVCT
jgi:hypothetical protein